MSGTYAFYYPLCATTYPKGYTPYPFASLTVQKNSVNFKMLIIRIKFLATWLFVALISYALTVGLIMLVF